MHTWFTRVEDSYSGIVYRNWCAENTWLPITTVILYVTLIAVFYDPQAHKRHRSTIGIKPIRCAWNLMLATFSILALIRSIEYHVYDAKQGTWLENMCRLEYDRVHSFWTMGFVLSKFVELGDTVFLIASGKKLLFLHWYHHVTVLLFSWSCFALSAPLEKYFGVMNLFVHSFMYSYFAVQSAGYKPAKWVAMALTSLQIAQMVAGIFFLWVAYSASKTIESCYSPRIVLVSGFMMYASYFILFVQFFISSYLCPGECSVTRPTMRKIK